VIPRAGITVAAVVALIGTSGAGVSQATVDDAFLVSQDGETFVTGATWQLFPDAGYVVPSDVISDDVWLQNAAAEPGRVQIRLDDLRADDRDLVESMTASVRVPGFDDVPVALGDVSDGCIVLHDGLELGPGETERVSATITIDPALGERPGDAGDAGSGATVSFVLRAVLTDANVPGDADPGDTCASASTPTPAPTAPSEPSEPGLPATGADAPLTAFGLGLFGAAAGLTLLWFTRRRAADRTRG